MFIEVIRDILLLRKFLNKDNYKYCYYNINELRQWFKVTVYCRGECGKLTFRALALRQSNDASLKPS